MKYIVYIVFVIGVLFTSCSDEFLETEPYGELTEEQVGAPENIMAAFKFSWRFERGRMNCLWIEAGKYVPDGPILARGIERLEDEQNGILPACVKRPQQVCHLGVAPGQNFFRRRVARHRRVR